MMYILTEEEMKNFQADRDALRSIVSTLPSTKTLQKMCTKIANEWPTFKRYDGKLGPWECIITADYEHCCDKCPVQIICPYGNKEWSK